MYPEDHPILDLIATWLRERAPECNASRESECVEFTDPETGDRFEIVVRAIDEDEDDADD